MKICNVCKEEKKYIEFFKSRNGLETFCKKCKCQKRRDRKAKDPDKCNEKTRLQSKKQRESDKFKVWRKEHQRKNREKIRKQQREYSELNREKVREYNRSYRNRNFEKFKESHRKSCEKYPERYKARKMLNYAIEYGYITRKERCERCEIFLKTEAHHPDYSKPLEVVWMCKSCHTKEHYR